jgi:hypothetical protein
MKRGSEKQKVIPVSPKLQAAWDALVERRPAAVAFHAHELPGADAEIERVLKQTTQAEADTASAAFLLQPHSKLSIEVRWVLDPEVVKKHKGKQK